MPTDKSVVMLSDEQIAEIEAIRVYSGYYDAEYLSNKRDALCQTVRVLREENGQLHADSGELAERLIRSADRSGELLVEIGELQSRLAQVEQEREEALREASRQSMLADDYACDLTDAEHKFTLAVNLVKEKATRYETLTKDTLPNDQTAARLAASARTLRELANELENLDHKGVVNG